MAVDLSVFDKQKTLLELQAAFDAQKAQRQQLALQNAVAVQKLQNGGTEKPNAVAEYEYFNQLPDDQKQQYLTVKRTTQIQNLGNQFGTYNPLTGQTQPIQGSQIAVSPDQSPMLKGAQAYATNTAQNAADLLGKPQIELATKNAENQAANQQAIVSKGVQADSTLNLVNEARQLLPHATGGGADNVGKAVKGYFGISDDKTKADARLQVIASGLTSAVPRMQGPQSDRDVQLYQQAAGDVANSAKSRDDRIAALKTIEDLQNKYKNQAEQYVTIPSVSAAQFPSAVANNPLPSSATPAIIRYDAQGNRIQ